MDSPLKQGPKRTILLEGTSSPRRVVKRFHSPGTVDGIKDGLRAWREYRALCRLRRRGLPVPRPLGVRRRDGSWELVQEELTACVPLSQLLLGSEPWPTTRRTIATALGELLANLWTARIWHPDLHMGNVLVGPGGEVHLIDLARVRTRWTRNVHGFLLPLAAGARELADGPFRARVLIAFSQVCGDSRSLLGCEAFERKARERRRKDVRKRLVRYRRVSGAMAALREGNTRGLVHRDLENGEEVLAGLDRCQGFSPAPFDPGREVQVLEGPLEGALLQRWNLAAQLESHGIRAERPLAWVQTPRARVLFDRPGGCRPLGECWSAWSPDERFLAARTAGALLGALRDRGLEADAQGALCLLAASPTQLLLQPSHLTDQPRLQPSENLQLWKESIPQATRTESEAFAQAFAAAQRGTRAERMQVMALLSTPAQAHG